MFIGTTFNTHYMFNIIVQTIHILHFYQLYIWNKSVVTFTYIFRLVINVNNITRTVVSHCDTNKISNFVFHMIHIK